VIIAQPGGRAPGSTGPLGACCSNDGTCVRSGHPQKGGTDRIPAASEALQRRRERLELAAIAAGSRHPEQIAEALISGRGGR
jgi:hypothetical protein